MEPIAVATALLGVLVIVTRAPLVFAPTATLDVTARLIAKSIVVRGLGALLAALGAALVVTASDAREVHGGIAVGLGWLGWLLAATAAWLLIAPGSYRRFVEMVIGMFDDPPVLRMLGALGTCAGLAFVWLGVAVL